MKKVRIAGLSKVLDDLSPHTIYRLVEKGQIPYQRVGRTLFFDLGEIDRWMAQQGLPTPSQDGDEQ